MMWIFSLGIIWLAVMYQEFRKVAYWIGGIVTVLLVLGIIT